MLKVSIICIVYNIDPILLAPCLESLARQTLQNNEFEIIIVDDNSSKIETLSILCQFKARHQNVTLIQHEKNRGLSAARQTGLQEASAPYVTFVDGDDTISHDACEIFYREAILSGCDIVSGQFVAFSPRTLTFNRNSASWQLVSNRYIDRMRDHMRLSCRQEMWGRLFRRDILRTDFFDLPEKFVIEDVVILGRILAEARSVSMLEKVVYFYTLNESSIMANFNSKTLHDICYGIRALKKIALSSPFPETLLEALCTGADRRLSICVHRCLTSNSMNASEKIATLKDIRQAYEELELPGLAPKEKGTRVLFALDRENQPQNQDEFVCDTVLSITDDAFHRKISYDDVLDFGLKYHPIADELCESVVFVATDTSQIEIGLDLCEALQSRGIPCVNLDASGTSRSHDHFEHSQPGCVTALGDVSDLPTVLATAKLIVVTDDTSERIRDSIEFRKKCGLPTLAALLPSSRDLPNGKDGLSDLLFRRASHVMFSGFDGRYYLLNSELSDQENTKPSEMSAGINPSRDRAALLTLRSDLDAEASRGQIALADVKNAFCEAGFTVEIDRATAQQTPGSSDCDLTNESPKNSTRHDYSVYVSDTYLDMLRSLVLGKPSILYRPVTTCPSPTPSALWGCEVATTPLELTRALQKIQGEMDSDVDFPLRAQLFLRDHFNFSNTGQARGHGLADLCQSILNETSGSHEHIMEEYGQRRLDHRREVERLREAERKRKRKWHTYASDIFRLPFVRHNS